MISLDNYAKYVNDLTTSRKENSEMKITIMNIDDIFRHLLRMGVEEVEVNKYQMSMITSLFVAGCGKTEVGAKAMLEGRIDTFFGIKLKLI